MRHSQLCFTKNEYLGPRPAGGVGRAARQTAGGGGRARFGKLVHWVRRVRSPQVHNLDIVLLACGRRRLARGAASPGGVEGHT